MWDHNIGKLSARFDVMLQISSAFIFTATETGCGSYHIMMVWTSYLSYGINFYFQDLTITVTTERPDTEIDIIPDENEMSGINVQTFVDQQVCALYSMIGLHYLYLIHPFVTAHEMAP